MITRVDNLESVPDVDLSVASYELAEARLQHTCKDTPDNRAAVVAARGRIDALLDMYLEANGLRR
jgi:hypothetical protein